MTVVFIINHDSEGVSNNINNICDFRKSVATTQKGNPNSSPEIGTLKESDVEKMSAREYEANQENITKAIQSGKFIYDLSGSAR